jgi:hypothetical protein
MASIVYILSLITINSTNIITDLKTYQTHR